MSKQTQEILIKANTIFENIADNAGAKALLAEFGYDDARLAEGVALFEAAKTATEGNIQGYSERYAASANFAQLRDVAYETYSNFTKLARVALANMPTSFNQLGLVGRRGTSFAKMSEQIAVFYTAALTSPTIMTALGKFGITEAKLSAGRATLTAAQAALAQQKQDYNEAVNSTATRNDAVAALSTWISAFLVTAKVALANQPDVWATLGV